MSYITTVTGRRHRARVIAHLPRERTFPALLLRRPALYCMCRGGDRARVFPGSDPRLSAARRERGVSVRCDAPGQEAYPTIFAGGGKAAGSNLEAVHRQGINRRREKADF